MDAEFDRKLQLASGKLRALTHPLRLKILELIDHHEKISLEKLFTLTKIEQSIAFQHLRVLKTANIVSSERDGHFIYYKINYPEIYKITKVINQFLNDET